MGEKVKRYTKEELDYIRKITPGRHYHEIVDMFNKKFERQIDSKKLKSTLRNHGISTGLTGRFEKGITPHNKGKKFSLEQVTEQRSEKGLPLTIK